VKVCAVGADDHGAIPARGEHHRGVEHQGHRRSANSKRSRPAASSCSVSGPPVSSTSLAKTTARSSLSNRARPASFSQALTDLTLPSVTSRRARSATSGSRLIDNFVTVIVLCYRGCLPITHRAEQCAARRGAPRRRDADRMWRSHPAATESPLRRRGWRQRSQPGLRERTGPDQQVTVER
jgi:hypothetical protein